VAGGTQLLSSRRGRVKVDRGRTHATVGGSSTGKSSKEKTMNSFRQIVRTGCWLLALMLGQTTVLWAQIGEDEGPKDSWVLPYAMVILSIGLALFVICRNGKRSSKVKAEEG
jgi:hypothetical protein